ncbi:MAG: MFS transporter [Gaiellaceae bacterium]
MTRLILSTGARAFSSLRHHRNYRYFFAGQVVSQTGTWMQRIAQGWFVLEITHSPVAVGILALAQFLPFTVLGLFAGVVVDRFDARRMVIWTQAAQMVLASALAGLALAGTARTWQVYVIAALNGMLLVLDAPARQALTYRMVGPAQLPNAVALNSSLFNAARIFGPAAGGIVIAAVGVGWCFALNAASFLAVLAGLLAMRPSDFHPLEQRERPSILRGTRQGLAYVARDRRALIVLFTVVMLSTFCFNFNVLLPVLAKQTLHAGPQSLGLLSAMFGGGALLGALLSAAQRKASLKVMLLGGLLFTASELLLAPERSTPLVAAILFFTGVGFTLWTSNSNSTLQLEAPDHLRGRVVGLYYYAFNGTGPLGGILAGWLSARGGTELAFVVAGIAGVVATAIAAAQLRERNPRQNRLEPLARPAGGA